MSVDTKHCHCFCFDQLDGEPITDLNIQEYRKNLALVSQEPTLYAGSVRFNILLGAIKPKEEVTQEEIEDACRNANILEFIQGLPQYVLCSLLSRIPSVVGFRGSDVTLLQGF